MDDETGWNRVLVEGWDERTRTASADRVVDAMLGCPAVLLIAVTDHDGAEPHWVERTHAVVVEAIRDETGADLDHLGSQAAWATYDDVWEELGRRADDLVHGEPVPDGAERQVAALLRGLPAAAVERAGGAMRRDGSVRLVARRGVVLVDVEALFRWLATEVGADEVMRQRARDIVTLVRAP